MAACISWRNNSAAVGCCRGSGMSMTGVAGLLKSKGSGIIGCGTGSGIGAGGEAGSISWRSCSAAFGWGDAGISMILPWASGAGASVGDGCITSTGVVSGASPLPADTPRPPMPLVNSSAMAAAALPGNALAGVAAAISSSSIWASD